MNIPNLPTDNLYKFKALSGLILIISSIVLFVTEFKSINDEIITIQTELDVKILETDFLYREFRADSIELVKFEKDTEKSIKDVNELSSITSSDTSLSKENQFHLFYNYIKSKNKAEARNDIEFRLKHMSDFFPLVDRYKLIEEKEKEKQLIYKKFKIANTEYEGKIKKMKYRYYNFIAMGIIIMILTYIGYRLCNKGFNDWYNLVQKFQDEKLKIEVEQLKKAVEQNKAK